MSVTERLANPYRAVPVNIGTAMISDLHFCCHRDVKQQMEKTALYLNNAAVIGKESTVGLA